MVKNSAAEVQVFAGIDVSARELGVAVHSRTVDREQAQTFSNNASGHHALRAHLLRGKGHVRVCLEASGNYSLVRSSLDFARPPPGGSQCSEPSSRAAFRGIPRGAQQDRSGRCPCALPIRLPHALASFGATQQAGLALAWPDTSHRSTGCYSDTGEESSALVAGQQGSIYIPNQGTAAAPGLPSGPNHAAAARSTATHRPRSRTRSAFPSHAYHPGNRRNQRFANPWRVSCAARHSGCSPVACLCWTGSTSFYFWHHRRQETADQPRRQSSSAAGSVHAGTGCHTS